MNAVISKDPASDLEKHDPDSDSPLDPGIRRYVLVLRSEGIETFESCEGSPGHAFREPTVRFHGNAFEGYKAFAIAMTYGLPVQSVRHAYAVVNERLEGPWWEMTFHATGPQAGSTT